MTKDKQYDIESGVPIPPKFMPDTNSIRTSLKQLCDGEVGRSIYFPGKHIKQISSRCSEVGSAWFTARTMDGGVRVWKVGPKRPGSGKMRY